MVQWYGQQSNANKVLIQSFLALVVAAIVSGLTAGWQSYVTDNGQLDVSVVAGVFLTTFALAFGKAMYSFVPAHIQQELAFLQDQYSALSNSHQVLINHVQTVVSNNNAAAKQLTVEPAQPLQGPLVHIYTSSGGDPQIATTNDAANLVQTVSTPVEPTPVESLPTQRVAAVVQPTTSSINSSAFAMNSSAFVNPGTSANPGTYIDLLASPQTAPQPVVQVPFPTK